MHIVVLSLLCNGTVKQVVRLQANQVTSTTHAEINGMCEGTCDVKYCRNVLAFFENENVTSLPATPFYVDSKSARLHATNPKYSQALRHMYNKEFFAREAQEEDEIAVQEISGRHNPADIGTKYLGRLQTEEHAQFLMNLRHDELASTIAEREVRAHRAEGPRRAH